MTLQRAPEESSEDGHELVNVTLEFLQVTWRQQAGLSGEVEQAFDFRGGA